MSAHSLQILLVEDNPTDARLIQETLASSPIPHRIQLISNGSDALAFLHRQGRFINAPRPSLILLDLNLPVLDGHELLAQIKSDDTLKRIPVVILTASKAEDDVVKAYDLCANCYVTKPEQFDAYVRAVQGIERFWIATANLPCA